MKCRTTTTWHLSAGSTFNDLTLSDVVSLGDICCLERSPRTVLEKSLLSFLSFRLSDTRE